MIDRHEKGDRALLVQPEILSTDNPQDLDEFKELARAAGAEVVGVLRAPREQPHPATLIGSGKVEEVAARVKVEQADLVLVNHPLTPIQERNLERQVKCRVHDRSTLILDIFAQRARSHEGKLQVELAQLRHMSTRLVRGWTHLERQKGGIGLRGPGETQLETDRRLLGDRVRNLRRRLDKLSRQRDQGRRQRQRNRVPVVSLVGYTNAGKSTLFNALTDSEVFAADQLFATLDPTLRKIRGLNGRDLLLADTVGFVRHLPHELIAAFRATLEETREADLLLHVVDASDPERDERIHQVNEVLQTIGAADVPQVLVYNKIDLTGHEPGARTNGEAGAPGRAWISAIERLGFEPLLQVIHDVVFTDHVVQWLELPPSAGRARSRLFEMGAVLAEESNDSGGWNLQCELSPREARMLARDPELRSCMAPLLAEMASSADGDTPRVAPAASGR
ncbi:MAG: GTPase HflX [Xanthomonadales bacterium]|nr:GTPase HflX [Xanthomonadales bacterium]